MRVKATLWDIGGVLTTSPFEAFNRFEADNGLPQDFIRSVNSHNPDANAWAQFESNQVTLEEFDALFRAESAALGHAIGGRQVVELLSGNLRPRMIRALAACKARFKVGAITNNLKPSEPAIAPREPARAAEMQDVMALFDVVVESSIEGVRKPNPEIYRRACERLRVAPEQCVFLDDLGINLKPARAMGMTTIKVVGEDQALRELAAATGLALG